MKKIALIAASLAVLASPALAQTTGTAPAEAKFSTVAKDEMFSSKLKGLNVYNQKDEKVGEITDLAIGKGEQIEAMILSVGGFLGVWLGGIVFEQFGSYTPIWWFSAKRIA